MWSQKEFGERIFGRLHQISFKDKPRTLPHSSWDMNTIS
jgi:hypothetical protein